MKQHTVWISFDLGVQGDYTGMYEWLDRNGAKECGDNFAYVKLKYPGDLIAGLQHDLKDSMELDLKKNRIYIVRQIDNGKLEGRFIFGGRKKSPWEGFSPTGEPSVDNA